MYPPPRGDRGCFCGLNAKYFCCWCIPDHRCFECTISTTDESTCCHGWTSCRVCNDIRLIVDGKHPSVERVSWGAFRLARDKRITRLRERGMSNSSTRGIQLGTEQSTFSREDKVVQDSTVVLEDSTTPSPQDE
ncbi:ORF3 [Penaeus monodon metallodensovirus]|uniref:ORF3 n=1 Tax=Penaeus monodon metallodensovirus TaxID=2672571 RepID=UPI002481EBFA|nr:ORF3 [Penaeus monodon metallodensovirus]QGX07569.1 ORF3 [Penaeus monodon metallodensovirus]